MTAILLISGVAIILLTLADIFFTTLTTRGAGPLTARVMETVWSGLLAVHRRRHAHRLLANGGAAITVCVVLLWVLLLWLGWSLIYNASETAVVEDRTGEPADVWARIYFAGFNLFSLGLGDYRPTGAPWQIATALTVANGLLTITLAITYLVPVLSAATEKRHLAATIAGLGQSPTDILVRSWDGRGFGALNQHLMTLGLMITSQSQQHLAYPALHYFHSVDPETALAPRLAALDEALHLMRHVVAEEVRPDPAVLGPLDGALSSFLRSLADVHIAPTETPPPLPPLDGLRRRGIPLDPRVDMERAFASLEERRRLMLGFVRSDGWSWPIGENRRR
jgi:hypothetical protein